MAILLCCFANFWIWSLPKRSFRTTSEPWELKNRTCICLLNNRTSAHRVVNSRYCHDDREMNSFFFFSWRETVTCKKVYINCPRLRNPIQLFGNRLFDASLNKTFYKLGSCFLNMVKWEFFTSSGFQRKANASWSRSSWHEGQLISFLKHRDVFVKFMRYWIHVQSSPNPPTRIISGQKAPFIILYSYHLRSTLLHCFRNNEPKQLISLILQRISNDYAKSLLSGHVAHWEKSCLLN